MKGSIKKLMALIERTEPVEEFWRSSTSVKLGFTIRLKRQNSFRSVALEFLWLAILVAPTALVNQSHLEVLSR
jgi:hypothetical protein